MSACCYVGLGANLGNREEAIGKALRMLDDVPGVSVGRVSSFYETPPWGKQDQPPFVNAAAGLWTSLSPLALLHACQSVEQALGRVRRERWGPRTMDIDLLWAEEWSMRTEELSLPHPYLLERAFVLVPLAEIVGDAVMEGKTFREWCDRLPERVEIQRMPGAHRSIGGHGRKGGGVRG